MLHGDSGLDGFMAGPIQWKMYLRRPRHRWDNIEFDLKAIGWEDMVWI